MGKDEDRDRSKRRKESKKKDKHKKKSTKKSGKEKERRHSHRHSSSGSSSSDSGCGGGGGGALTQLERDRAAVRAARALLAAHPAMRRDLRQLLWSVDNGKAVGVGGVPDPGLRSDLEQLLSLLGLRCSKVCLNGGYGYCRLGLVAAIRSVAGLDWLRSPPPLPHPFP